MIQTETQNCLIRPRKAQTILKRRGSKNAHVRLFACYGLAFKTVLNKHGDGRVDLARPRDQIRRSTFVCECPYLVLSTSALNLIFCEVRALKMRKGEVEIDSINSAEDTKGNNGERGALIISNLRLIWVSHKSQKTNLSKF
jgi:hypothetical protein